jgi:hypothetical protein
MVALGGIMAGTLFHGPRFEQIWYAGNDGVQHYELAPCGGDMEVVSQSSWWALVAHFESAGVPRDAWPVYDSNIDLPLCEILEQNVELRKQISGLMVSDGVLFGSGLCCGWFVPGRCCFIVSSSFGVGCCSNALLVSMDSRVVVRGQPAELKGEEARR